MALSSAEKMLHAWRPVLSSLRSVLCLLTAAMGAKQIIPSTRQICMQIMSRNVLPRSRGMQLQHLVMWIPRASWKVHSAPSMLKIGPGGLYENRLLKG